MIQRIQSIYLLVITALTATASCLPLAWMADYNDRLELCAFALRDSSGATVQSTVYLGILLVLASLLPLVTIFLYKRRMLQIRLCAVEMVLLLGASLMEGIYYYLSRRAFFGLEHPEGYVQSGIQPVIFLPLVGLIFAYLAIRAIFRDELLVRGVDRIR